MIKDINSADTKRAVYFINEVLKTDKGYQVCIAKEGEPGYYLTDWFWKCSKKEADELCIQKNTAMGISKIDAMKIIMESMFNNYL